MEKIQKNFKYLKKLFFYPAVASAAKVVAQASPAEATGIKKNKRTYKTRQNFF